MKITLYSILLLSSFMGIAQLKFTDLSETSLPQIAKEQRNSMDAKAVDLDQDGDLDLVVGIEFYKNVILLNDGNGVFADGSHLLPDIPKDGDAKPYPWYPWHDTEDVAIEDFDEDGDLDIVFVTEDDKTNEYYINNSQGKFWDKTMDFPAEGTSNGVIAGDFDGDGWMDLVIGNNGQNVYLRNDQGKWIDETNGRLPKDEDITQDLQAIDFDQDGDLDLLVANEKFNKILVNNGKGQFKDKTSRYLKEEVLGEETREALFIDVDSDGDLDLYFANVFMFQQIKPIQRLLINDGKFNFNDETEQRLGFTDKYNCIDANFADLDSDGDLDLLLLTFGKPKLFENDGRGFFKDISAEVFGELETDGVDSEIADFNGDGKLDVFISAFRGADKLLIQK